MFLWTLSRSKVPFYFSVSFQIIFTIETVLMFALEPTGSKFAILHGDPPTRISVSFYRLEKGAPVTKISEFCQKFETPPVTTSHSHNGEANS